MVEKTYAPQTMQISMEVGDSQTCIRVVSQGLGYALVPHYCISPQAAEECHIEILHDQEGQPIIRNMWMVYNETNLRLNAVKAFVPFVENSFLSEDCASDLNCLSKNS